MDIEQAKADYVKSVCEWMWQRLFREDDSLLYADMTAKAESLRQMGLWREQVTTLFSQGVGEYKKRRDKASMRG